MPALLKGFLAQVARPGFAFTPKRGNPLDRNIVGFVGISPVNETLVGNVDTLSEAGVKTWTDKLRKLGGAAQ